MSRLIARIGGALLAALLLASTSGCADSDVDGTSESNVVSSAPPPVGAAADLFGLGKLESSSTDQFAGTFEYERGTVSFDYITKKVDDVRVEDPDLAVSVIRLHGQFLKAALYLELGSITSVKEPAASKLDVVFERGTVHLLAPVDDPDPTIESIVWSNGSVLSGEPLVAASSLELGKLESSDHGGGSTYYQFVRGTIRVLNEDASLKEVTVTDPTVNNPDNEGLPREVVLAAAQASFGRVVSIVRWPSEIGGPGQLEARFELGSVHLNGFGHLNVVPRL